VIQGGGFRTPKMPFASPRTLTRVLLAVALSALVDRLVWMERSTHLTGHINIVGYPTFWNFDYLPSFLEYRLVTYAFPTGVILIYWALDRRLPRRVNSRVSIGRAPLAPVHAPTHVGSRDTTSSPGPAPWNPQLAWALARLIPPAVFLAFVTRTRLPVSHEDITGLRIVAGGGYVVGVAAAAWLTLLALRQRRPRSPWSYADCVSAVNAFAGAAAAIGGLWFVSHQTAVLLPTGGVRVWSWIPGWLTGISILAVWAWTLRRLHGGKSPSVVERWLRVVMLGSAAIYLIVALVPGPISAFNGFDDAQSLTGAALFQHGYFPWRDFQFIHGVFTDIFEAWLGFHLFQATAWGWIAGRDLVLIPLTWVGLYLLGVWANRRGSLIILGPILLAAWGGLGIDPRFITLAPVLILMGKSLSSDRLAWTAGLTVALFGEAITVPEASFQVVAVLLVVALADLVGRQDGERLRSGLPRIRCLMLTGVILTAGWATFLASQHALGGFIDYYLIFGPGHDASGAIPDTGTVGVYGVMFTLMIALVVGTVLVAAWRIHQRETMTPRGWVALAAAVNAGVYGEQALGRPDLGHVELSLDVALPLFALALAILMPVAEDWITTAVARLGSGARGQSPQLHRFRRGRARLGWHPQPLALACVGLVMIGTQSIPLNIWHAPERTRTRLGPLMRHSPLGYAIPGALPPGLLSDLRTVVATYSGSRAPFFDMTNSPGWFYYLLGLRPATVFTNISQAIPESAQQMLIGDLRRSHPAMIAFNDRIVGLPAWDLIPNEVRHFEVSQYVLDHWTPVLETHTFLFLLRNDLMAHRPPVPHLSQMPITARLYDSQPDCSWGYAANFLQSPAAGRSLTLHARHTRSGWSVSLYGWSFDRAAGRPAREVVVAEGDRAVAVLPVNVARPDVASALHTTRATDTGYSGSVLVSDPRSVRVYALTSDHKLHLLPRLGQQSTSPPASIRTPRGSRIPVGAVGTGSEDAATATSVRVSMFAVPASTMLPSINLLTLASSHAIGTSQFGISDLPGVSTAPSNTQITAWALPVTGSRLSVRVGSCLQWHGYRRHQLYVAQQGGAPITSVTLSGVAR
jgi:hypothetical protein